MKKGQSFQQRVQKQQDLCIKKKKKNELQCLILHHKQQLTQNGPQTYLKPKSINLLEKKIVGKKLWDPGLGYNLLNITPNTQYIEQIDTLDFIKIENAYSLKENKIKRQAKDIFPDIYNSQNLIIRI